MDMTHLLLFSGASLLLIVAPGPDIIYLVSQGVSGGKRAGFRAALGLSAGNIVHTIAAALGISAIFRTSALAFQFVKLLGAAYLLYLAGKAIAGRRVPAANAAAAAGARKNEQLFWRAFLMNVLNPKVALFFLAFLPQFASPEVGPVWLQMLLLGGLFAMLVLVVFIPIGVFAGVFYSRLIRAGGRTREVFAWLTASLYGALALRLVLARR